MCPLCGPRNIKANGHHHHHRRRNNNNKEKKKNHSVHSKTKRANVFHTCISCGLSSFDLFVFSSFGGIFVCVCEGGGGVE